MSGPSSSRPAARELLRLLALPCGTATDLLLEQVASGQAGDLTVHQRGCVHCQAALAEFAALWGPVAEFAAIPVPVPPGIAAAVMSQIRMLMRDVWYTLQITGDGAIRIAARIVAALARDAARTVPGVRVALGRSTRSRLTATAERASLRHRHPQAAIGVLGRTAVVDLAVAVGYGYPVHEVARDIQRQVISSLSSNLGLRSVTVNITVDDIIDAETDQPGRRRAAVPVPPIPGRPSDE